MIRVKKIKRHSDQCKEALLALRDSAELWSGKWRLYILAYLYIHEAETIFFKRMQRDLEGISAKMLSKELKEMEINDLIIRSSSESGPVAVSYALTEYGRTFIPVAEAMLNWGLNHRKKVKAAI
ncbi:winged helix-turn-helix transcriptional regulator [Chitinophaga sp. RAB17]|uniref:winged helix-turn-helix transcriptional regulator n=1 Tax=Chitinophaga sp. RAB17 TaxID=3233049 RepID=UPI003F92B4A2